MVEAPIMEVLVEEGSGAFREATSQAVSVQPYPIVVGGGGNRGPTGDNNDPNHHQGGDGGDTTGLSLQS